MEETIELNSINNQLGKKKKDKKNDHTINISKDIGDKSSSEIRYRKIRTNGKDIFIPDMSMSMSNITVPDTYVPNTTIPNNDLHENGMNVNHPNNWSPANVNVLRNWKTSLAKASFIYQYNVEITRTRLNRILIIALIVSTISTIISGISTIALTVNSSIQTISGNSTITLTVENPTYKLVALIINAIVFFLSAVVTILNGIIKIYKLDETVAIITPYIERIDQIYSKIANELVLPDALREDAIIFIKRESDNYLKLIQQSPDIDKSIEQQAIVRYNDYLKDTGMNFRLSQKYGNDAIIDVT